MKDFRELEEEPLRMLYALTLMYAQYCNEPYGHLFMGAGEHAIDVLEDYGLASEDVGINDAKLDELEQLV